MAEVNYKQYREYQRQRIETNDTVMGMLVGSKLASQTLTLTAGSTMRLQDIFPKVPHVRRFNLTTEKARDVLSNAEHLLGILAVPQVLALHEDLIASMLKLIEQNDSTLSGLTQGLNMSNCHTKLENATNISFTVELVELFDLLRLARNEHIHNGGLARQHFVNEIVQCSALSKAEWKSITGTDFQSYHVGDSVLLGLSELIGALALTKRLAVEANNALQQVISKSLWSDLVVQEWQEHWVAGNSDQQAKRLRGIARTYYGAVNLSEADLADAQQRIVTS